MNKVQYAIGMHIFYNNVEYIVVRQINFQEIMAQNISIGEKLFSLFKKLQKSLKFPIKKTIKNISTP